MATRPTILAIYAEPNAAEAEVTPKVLRKIAIVTSVMAIVTPKSIVTPVYSGQNPEY